MKTPFYLARSPTTRLLLAIVFMLFWGGIALVFALIKVVKDRQKFFNVKRRDFQPEVLSDPSLGKHNYAQLSVKHKFLFSHFGKVEICFFALSYRICLISYK